MTKKFHILSLVIMLGFFLMPALTLACETNSEKSCCNKETSSNPKKMDCCKNDNNSKNKDNEGCSGKNKNASCSCPIFHSSTVLLFETELKQQKQCFNFLDKKQNFSEAETNLSSGFHSVWLIPKIS